MTQQHTVTPWTSHNRLKSALPGTMLITGESGEIGVCRVMDGSNTEANAAFIVRACNSHQALVDACKRALDSNGIWLTDQETGEMFGSLIEDALKLAGEEA